MSSSRKQELHKKVSPQWRALVHQASVAAAGREEQCYGIGPRICGSGNPGLCSASVRRVQINADMVALREEIRIRLLDAGATRVGFADISDLALSGFPQAIAVAIAYSPQIVDALHTRVAGFHEHLLSTRERMREVLEVGAECLRSMGFHVYTPEISKTLPGLTSEFPHKTAATKAGLGWIGKNALLVVPKIGCGLRLGSLLTDAGFPPDPPVVRQRCGRCRRCVTACPYGAIRGASWAPGIPRDLLLDASLCHMRRESFVAEIGFKHPCGLCIQACPRRVDCDASAHVGRDVSQRRPAP